MSGDIYLGAYWGPRQESADQCAVRLTKCLKEVASVSHIFASWYETGWSRKEALEKRINPVARDQLSELLRAGRNRRDSDKSIIEDLGFTLSLWNGKEDAQEVSFRCHCGCYSNVQGLGNSVVLDFPEVLGDLAEKERALKALMAVVRAWEPDWAGIISHESVDARPFTPGSPFVDWMIYLNQTNIDASELPSSASVVSVDGKGTIVITQDAPVDPSDQSHVQNVQAVESAIPA